MDDPRGPHEVAQRPPVRRRHLPARLEAAGNSAIVLAGELAQEVGLTTGRIAQVASTGELVGTLRSYGPPRGFPLRRWEFERADVDEWLANRQAREMYYGFEPAVLCHLHHLRLRNLQPATIYNRALALRALRQWAGAPLVGLDADTLWRWQEARARQVSAATRRTDLSDIRQFYRWALLEDLIRRDPTSRLIVPRIRHGVPRPMTEADLARAIAAADPRMAVIIGLAAFAGLRAGEIARLDWGDVALTGDGFPLLRVSEAKGGSGRLVPLGPALITLLDALPDRRGRVIRRAYGDPRQYPDCEISHLASRYLRRIGVTGTLHQARHRFCTVAYQACQDLRAVQELMGHACPATTARYAAASSTVVRDAVVKASQIGAPRRSAGGAALASRAHARR